MPDKRERRGGAVAIAFDCLFPVTTGGGERQYRAFAEELVRHGRAVDYLTAERGEEDSDSFRVVPITQSLRLYDHEGVRRPAAAVKFAFALFRTLLRRRRTYSGVIISATPVLNVFAARAALAWSGTKVVVDYLEVWDRPKWMEYSGKATGFIAWLLQWMAIAITPVATCHSRLTARRLSGEGFRGRLLLSPGLIDDIDDPGRLSDAMAPPYVLYAGRHIADKRVEALPPAVALARKQIPDLRLVILGEGPSTQEIRQSAQGADWVDFDGFVDDARLRSLMAGAACLANPSRREGYGLVVVEAAAFGTPAVLVDGENNASVDLVDDAVNGYIAPGADAESLAKAIVAAVHGGRALRARTRAWYEDAVRTRTITQTIQRILPYLD